jgi:hypothetical protein
LVDLTAGDLSDIETAASKIAVVAARHPEQCERLTGR